MTRSLTTVRIAEFDEIMASEGEWNNLVARMPLPSVFLTWDWITTWIKHFGRNYDLLILFAYEKGDLAAILPLARRVMRLEDGVVLTRALTICGSLELYPDHLDIISSSDNGSSSHVEHMFRFLSDVYRKWDTMSLPYLSSEGRLAAYIGSMKCDMATRFGPPIPAPYVTLDRDIDAFLADNFSTKRRHELRRQSRVLYENRKVTFRSVTEEREIGEAMDHLVSLHLARKEEMNVSSTFAEDAVIAFHKEIALRFHRKGWLRFYMMHDQAGDPVSAAYGFLYNGTFNYYQSGMAPGWNRYSPGKIIVLSMLKDLYDEGARELDFLGGNQEYKGFWAGKCREMTSYRVFNRTFGARVECLGSDLARRAKTLLRKKEVSVG